MRGGQFGYQSPLLGIPLGRRLRSNVSHKKYSILPLGQLAGVPSAHPPSLPLIDELFNDVLGAEVQIDFRGGQVIVPEEPLQCRQADPLLHGRHAEGVREDVGAELRDADLPPKMMMGDSR
jgi:hypothetical protein